MIAGGAFFDDFAPPTSHCPNHHGESGCQRPKLSFFDPEEAGKSPERPKPERKRFQKQFYEELRVRKIQEMEMKTVLRDLVIYFFYVAIIFIISYGNRDPDAYLSKSAIESSVIFGGVNCDILPTDDPRYVPYLCFGVITFFIKK